jgi:hypothetical protein
MWFVPPDAGGSRWWVPQQKQPTVIGGYLFRPGSPIPRSTTDRPGLLDERGRPYAPPGTPMSSAVPGPVYAASHFQKESYAKARSDARRRDAALTRALRPGGDAPAKGLVKKTVRPRRHLAAIVKRSG